MLAHEGDSLVGVVGELIETDDDILTETPEVGEMAMDVVPSVKFKCGRGDDEHRGRRDKACLTAFDVKEFLCAEVCAEAGLRDGVVAESHGCLCGDDGVAAVCDVGKRTSVYESGSLFCRLHKVWTDGIH